MEPPFSSLLLASLLVWLRSNCWGCITHTKGLIVDVLVVGFSPLLEGTPRTGSTERSGVLQSAHRVGCRRRFLHEAGEKFCHERFDGARSFTGKGRVRKQVGQSQETGWSKSGNRFGTQSITA